MNQKTALFAILLFVVVILVTTARTTEKFSPYVDDQGKIQLPKDYRADWSYLGSWVVPDKQAPGYGFHDVFTQPEVMTAFKKSGEFPDAAVLVKEIRSIESADMTSGHANWAGPIDAWFVMVRDMKNRFPDNPNWGEGWGWALFKGPDPAENASRNYKNDCLDCHMPAKSTHWVYLRGYTIQ